MSIFRFFVGLALAATLGLTMLSARGLGGEQNAVQYLLFQIFTGGPDPGTGVFHRGRSRAEIQAIAQQIADAVRPAERNVHRLLGFAVGPIAMDQGADDATALIREAFDVAVASDMAVALHLDDYMFSSQAVWPDGRLLRAAEGVGEWQDWSRTPAKGVEIGYMRGVNLPPGLCYENPVVKEFTAYWSRDVIGRELKRQLDRLAAAGKTSLFAGVISGWESNLANGYCSLSQLGYSAERPPEDFDHERERVLHRYIERWAKGIYDAGVPRQMIFTHTASIPYRDYTMLTSLKSREQLRQMPGSTAFRAFWTAFNDYSNPGFTIYPDEPRRFSDIWDAVGKYGHRRWAMVEGTDAVPGPEGTAAPPPLDWETYLARSFNHGAALVNVFGGFQGENGGFQRATESAAAFAAYRKFLTGDQLVGRP